MSEFQKLLHEYMDELKNYISTNESNKLVMLFSPLINTGLGFAEKGIDSDDSEYYRIMKNIVKPRLDAAIEKYESEHSTQS